jgi:hypothetical protein
MTHGAHVALHVFSLAATVMLAAPACTHGSSQPNRYQQLNPALTLQCATDATHCPDVRRYVAAGLSRQHEGRAGSPMVLQGKEVRRRTRCK